MRKIALFVAALLFGISAVAIGADEIALPSARLPGELLSLSDGVVKFKTPFGELSVPVAELRGLIMDSEKEIAVGDAGPAMGKLIIAADGTFDWDGKKRKISDLVSITPPAPPEEPVKELQRWSGSLAATLILTDGNTNNTDASLEASLLRDHMKKQDGLKYKISAFGKYFTSENAGLVTKSAGSAGLQVDALLHPDIGAFVSGAWSFDYFAGIHSKTAWGAGLNLIVANSDELKLNVSIGASWVGIYYNRWSIDAARAAGGSPAEFVEYPGLLVKAELVWQTPIDFEYGFKVAMNKSVLDADNYELTGETWISRNISGGWFLRISAGFSRSEPVAPGKLATDSVLTVALMFKF